MDNAAKARIALIVGALVIVGVIIGRVTAPGGDSSDSGDSGEETGGTTDAGTDASAQGLPFPTGDVNRVNYWGFANLEPVVIDTFHRSDADSLGNAGTEQAWSGVTGSWGIRDDSASQLSSSSPGPSIAIVDEQGQGDGLTEATMTVVEEGAGLIFRYSDPENYWSVTANPSIGSWSVTRVIDGEAEPLGEVPGPTVDGVTLSVIQSGSLLRFLLDGEQYLQLRDRSLANQLQGGLIGPGGTSEDARWNSFMIMRLGEASPTETTVADG